MTSHHETSGKDGSPFHAGDLSHIATEPVEELPSFIQHGRGELEKNNEVLHSFQKFKLLSSDYHVRLAQ